MFKIEEMNLYKTTDRFLNNYKHLKKSLKRAPTLEEISDIDQLHYNGIEAVNEAIIKTKITFIFYFFYSHKTNAAKT